MTTATELNGVFDARVKAAVQAGVSEATGWQLETGSKTYGRAYRIWLQKDDGTGAHHNPMVNDYLGMTKAEAVASIRAMRAAFNAVIWSRQS